MASKTEREAPEVGSMVQRMIRALVRRAAEGDLEALEQLAHLESELSEALTVAGKLMQTGERMHSAGYSFTELGSTLGISRQAARQRFSRGVDSGSYYLVQR